MRREWGGLSKKPEWYCVSPYPWTCCVHSKGRMGCGLLPLYYYDIRIIVHWTPLRKHIKKPNDHQLILTAPLPNLLLLPLYRYSLPIVSGRFNNQEGPIYIVCLLVCLWNRVLLIWKLPDFAVWLCSILFSFLIFMHDHQLQCILFTHHHHPLKKLCVTWWKRKKGGEKFGGTILFCCFPKLLFCQSCFFCGWYWHYNFSPIPLWHR